MGTVGSHDQSCEDKMTSLVIACLVMGASTQAHTLTKRSAVHAVPVVSTPAVATAGYAVGASGAIGGQAPATIAAPAPVVAYAGALPVAHHSAVAIASHAIPTEHHSVPIVTLTHATLGTSYPQHATVGTSYPHGFSYGFSSVHPSLLASPALNTLAPKIYSSVDISSVDDAGVASAVDLRTASGRRKRDAGYLGYHGGHVLGLKSAPCVNVNNVPVPCATGALFH